ncbi:Major facilitator superfamily domain, general substrate transporter [Penicillium expansum]|uniref:Major facilitator superfamily domain, general substrate transporter n=1 Tax=Penicillium expansum TaxID=27334 RepID=A0A0A2IAN2_PENEN|nr:Major facilitator superfamily domain, general substrate transporter [Penicillium expansum]KGO39493.1 Major facilitator superfamily domain, general substrate transporter [Penicillium expansum]KGO55737.1 Major facilitator superfamily domain, general substrate transporter [Penicillium expansum]KGO70764.1 Major facilitator superfamily domain, general substrate transporter [Penicillium expansum]
MRWIKSRWSTNPYYALVIAVIACGGIPKGYDEGGYSASVSLPSFKSDYNLDKHLGVDETELANRKANITSFNVLGAALGALIVLDLNDRLGRLMVWRLACIVWATGTLIQVFSSAPARTRGLVVGIYMVFLLAFLAMGFFINYGARVHMATTRTQYRLVQAVPLIPVGIASGISYLCPETPRYLVSKHLHREGLEALARLRGRAIDDPEIIKEFATIDARERERATDLASVSHWAMFKETQTNPNYRQRFWLLMAMQTIAQWTGGNGITYYVTSIFQYAGVKGDGNSLISSGAYGMVKLIFTMAFTWGLIDLLGRRRCTLAGLSLQLCAHIYMGIYMGLRPGSADNKNASNAAVASIFVYAVGWSIGLCTVPYLYGTEIFPTRIRNVSYAISMALHWFFQFAVVRVTPNMLVSLDVWGAFLFWALICFSGLVILGVWMPETKGVPIERMGDLFDGPWYLRWRARSRDWDLVSPTDMSQNIASKDGRVLKSGDSAL